MCCFFLAIMFGGPRLGILVMWLIPQGQLAINRAFSHFNYPFLPQLLGFVFIPWTTLMYPLVYGVNGLEGFDWIWLGLAVVLDIATWSGGSLRRKSVPGYPATAP